MANAPHTVKDAREGPQGWFGRHPRLTGVIGSLAFLIALVAFFDWGAKRRLAARIAAIQAAGQPASVEDLIKTDRPIPAERNMTPAILESAAPFLEDNRISPEVEPLLPVLGSARSVPPGEALPEEQVGAIRAYLAQFEAERAAVRAALDLPSAWLEIEWKSPLVGADWSDFRDFREIAKLLALETLDAMESGDCPRVAAALAAQCRLAEAMSNPNPPLIAALIQMANNALAEDMVERGVNRCTFDDAQLRRLQERVRRLETIVDMHRAMIVERVVFMDGVFRGRAQGTGSFIANLFSPKVVPGRIGLPMAPIMGSLDVSAGLDFYSRLIAACEYVGPAALLRAREAEAAVMARPKYYGISGTLVPSMTRAVELWLRGIGSNRALHAALACERFRLAHGRWPAHLGELVPEYLDVVPLDPFDEKPIRYVVIPEGARTWSIGEDGEDNGGEVYRLEDRGKKRDGTDWGWILLNPELRGRPAGAAIPATHPGDDGVRK
ncbi:MAG: hypothetical protein DCC65_17695 [Planctomycetota bacterium]|nr:MAG: hypothetical protein DCC65_17695 [Planctomycetota bacterium]